VNERLYRPPSQSRVRRWASTAAVVVLASAAATAAGALATASPVVTVAVDKAAASSKAPASAKAPIDMYRGLGIWVDMYDAAAWNDPTSAVDDMAKHGVRTLYVETANYHWPKDINRPAALSAMIRACHDRGLKIVAWYLPGLKDLTRDYSRSMAAIDYGKPGDWRFRFDSFALDIEASIVKPASTRNARLRSLSQKIRKAVGAGYPLGGIIPSPAGMAKNATYWPGFPYKDVAAVYDVIVPMGYYTYHGDGYANAYRDTRDNVRIIRAKTGRPSIPIHVIAGVADKSSASETLAYVRALRENGCVGGSMYDWPTTGGEDWRALANVRVNPTQTPSLPRDVGYLPQMGNCPGERTHPKEVFYQAPPQAGDRVLRFRLFDAQTKEIRLFVNWKDMGALEAGPGGRWSAPREVVIPAASLNAKTRNVIGFVARGQYPDWRVWGVRDVTLTSP
jgi:hypothetical protein